MTRREETDRTPLDRLFVDDLEERPDGINVDELTTMDADEFVARLESLADAADVVTTLTRDLEQVRQTGLTDSDAKDLIYGRNAHLRKRDIDAVFSAVDALAEGRANRPVERLLSDLSDVNLSETREVMDELERMNRKYGEARE